MAYIMIPDDLNQKVVEEYGSIEAAIRLLIIREKPLDNAYHEARSIFHSMRVGETRSYNKNTFLKVRNALNVLKTRNKGKNSSIFSTSIKTLSITRIL